MSAPRTPSWRCHASSSSSSDSNWNVLSENLAGTPPLRFEYKSGTPNPAENSMLDPLDDNLQALVIRAVGLTLGLRRIPAGFHVVVKTDGAEFQTSNKLVHIDQAVVEWNEPILLPCETYSKVQVSVYASFELGPVLCHGEVLRTFEISIGELLDCSEKSRPIIFQPKQEEVVSACTSLFMTVEQRLSDKNDVAVLCPANTLTSHDMDVLALNTDAGHRLLARYCRMQNSRDLDQSINHFECTLDLCPVDHPYPPCSAVQSSHCRVCNDEDLDQAIAFQTKALALHPVGHTDQSMSLYNLANQLSTRFEHRGNDEDLDWAIATGKRWLCTQSLNNLAIQLSILFDHQGNDEDLDQAIALHREVLALHPVGHTYWSSSLNNLANQLASCFDHRGNNEDLDQAIALHREVLALHPVGHTDRSSSLNNLAIELSTCFDYRGNDEDLDRTITLQREALALHLVGHTYRSMSLNNLVNQLASRFDHRGNREDFDESRDKLRCALTLLMPHDPRQLVVQESLAEVFLSFHHSRLDGTSAGKDNDNLNAAMHHLKAAANVVSGGSLSRLRASLSWVRHAHQHSHGTELEARATSMQLLDAYTSTTASVSSRHNIMKDFSNTLAVDAASCALHSGDVCHTVELLEQGRTIIWTQMTRLRTPLDSLQTRGDHAATLMKEFRDLSSLLNKPPANYLEATTRINVEAEETRYRRLVKDWNGVVEEIRKIEGFSRFLLSPLFSDLQDAARDGPIILLIASKSSCDAIIIPHKQPLSCIQLPINFKILQRLVLALREAIEKEAGPKGNQPALIKVLRELSLSVSFAAIGQNRPASASFTLDSVEPELELVQSLLPHPPTVSFTKITSVDATKSRALTQKFKEPFKSAFLMRDHPLSLLDITQMDLSQHQFAFLSACKTAVGVPRTPDEVIHLAAGLQFAGVKSVVGTLWKVNDNTVQRLVGAFYKNLCKDGTMNSKRAAPSLHQAVQSLACDKDMPLDQHIVFIHIGV
ncbi:CHAT domain-containing protein [Suillus subalutaceus]|uniref:CHAT domain-containing protein n=1 Tax=Suillus subalutaceus TaxID=48586 RepID=UPI001B871987|nr:CHAT domain-containing protein [Suillus subalutaceus]KAG1842754.1 CHAT domain-containing protein [Suillus subalutaceus]